MATELQTTQGTVRVPEGRDFGLKWQQLLETGRLLVGDEVTVVIDISAVKAK